jgi:hypothetical protein
VSVVTVARDGAAAAPVVLFPNPAKARQGVQLQAAVAVTVRNALGQAVRTAELPVQAGRVDARPVLDWLPAGVYSVCMPTKSGKVSKRLVVL